MKILAIETSSAKAGVAVRQNGRLVEARSFEAPRGRGAEIFAILEELRASWTGLDRLALGIGPGSYNGLRVACALAGSFQMALGIDLVTAPSCCLLDVKDADYIAAGDARGDRMWWAEVRDRRLQGEIALLSREEFAEQIGNSALPVYAVGEIRGFESMVAASPDAAILASLAESLPVVTNPAQIEPIYLKPPHITAPKAGRPWLASTA